MASDGEWIGLAGGCALVLGTIGKGSQWLLGWCERRAETRATKLQAWHEELVEREAALDSRVETRLKKLEVDNAEFSRKDEVRAAESMALRLAFELVASALRSIDPGNTALSRAEQLLHVAFPLTPIVPPDMTMALQAIPVEVRDGKNS